MVRILLNGQKSGPVVSKLDSRLEGCGFKSHPMLDGNGVNVMPGSIPAPNPGSFNNWKERNIGSQMGHTKNPFEETREQEILCSLTNFSSIQRIRTVKLS